MCPSPQQYDTPEERRSACSSSFALRKPCWTPLNTVFESFHHIKLKTNNEKNQSSHCRVNCLFGLIDFVLKDRKNCVFISEMIKLHIEYASCVLVEFITEFILSMLWLRLMRIIITWLNYNSVLTLSRMKSFCWQASVQSFNKRHL